MENNEVGKKLKLANELRDKISSIESFISLIDEGQASAKKGYRYDNHFEGLKIMADVCTGDNFHEVEGRLFDDETIRKCVNAMKPVLEEILKSNIYILENIFK